MRIIDQQRDRASGGEVCCQPMQTMQHSERRIPAGRGPFGPGKVEHWPCEPGRTLEQLFPDRRSFARDPGLEQLPNHAEGQLLLQLPASSAQHIDAGLAPSPGGLLDETGLADARLPDDEHDHPAAGPDASEQLIEPPKFVLPLDKFPVHADPCCPHVYSEPTVRRAVHDRPFVWDDRQVADVSVFKRYEVSGARMWERIGDPRDIYQWHPAIEATEMTDDGKSRINTLTDGGRVSETILEQGERHHTYRIDESPLPLETFTATIRVRDEDGSACVVQGDAAFDAAGISDAEAAELVRGFLQAGLDAL